MLTSFALVLWPAHHFKHGLSFPPLTCWSGEMNSWFLKDKHDGVLLFSGDMTALDNVNRAGSRTSSYSQRKEAGRREAT